MKRFSIILLAAALGISRTPVAEAVASLTESGFIAGRDGASGSYVPELNIRDMINLYRVRTAIEGEAAALCAHTVDDETLHRLVVLADAFKDSVIRRDIRGMKDTDMPFHRLLINSCGNPYIVQSYELLLPKLTMYQVSMTEFIGKRGSEDNPWLPSIKYNHTSVVSAIRNRMPEQARQAMADHVTASLNFTTLSGTGSDPFKL